MDSFAFDRLVVRARRRGQQVAIDGEIFELPTPLIFRIAHAPATAGARASRRRGRAMILHITDTHFGAERPEVVRGLIELARAQRLHRW